MGYKQTRQSGSHGRMTLSFPRQAHLTVAMSKPLAAGTLAVLVKDAAALLETTVDAIVSQLR